MSFKANSSSSRLKFYYIIFFILSCLTFVINSYIEKFNITAANLINTSETETNIINGELIVIENSDVITKIASNNTKSYTSHLYVVDITSDRNFVNFESDIKSVSIKHGELYWEAARVTVFFLDSHKNLIKGTNHTARHIYKDHDWFTINHTFIIPAEAIYAKAGVEFLNSSGLISIKNTKLRYAEESVLHQSARYILLLAWLITILLFIKTLTKGLAPYIKYIFTLVLFLIIAGIIIPQDIKLAISSHMFPQQSQYIHIDSTRHEIKFAESPMIFFHFTAFTIMAFLSLVSFSRYFHQASIIINLIILSIISEVLQILSLGRTPQTSDIIIDNFGILLGFITYNIYMFVLSKR